eukprot:scaffold41482_cov34-Phaeocystis_antarctica.AAC.1
MASKGAVGGVLGAHQLPSRQPQPVLERGVACRIPLEQRLSRLAPQRAHLLALLRRRPPSLRHHLSLRRALPLDMPLRDLRVEPRAHRSARRHHRRAPRRRRRVGPALLVALLALPCRAPRQRGVLPPLLGAEPRSTLAPEPRPLQRPRRRPVRLHPPQRRSAERELQPRWPLRRIARSAGAGRGGDGGDGGDGGGSSGGGGGWARPRGGGAPEGCSGRNRRG